MRRRLLVPILLLLAVPLWAGNIPATFYVDSVGGNDNSSINTGLATDNAWKTVAQVNAFSRQNIALYSEKLDNTTGWTRYTAPTFIADNAIAPDGTLTAERITQSANQEYHGIYQAISWTAVPYTVSIYAKKGTINYILMTYYDGNSFHTWFDINSGAAGTTAAGVTTTISSAPNGYYRCSITFTPSAGDGNVKISGRAANNDATPFGDTGNYIYIWGADVKVGGLSPYIPTVASPVTASFQPGDSILFKRGQSWAETLTIPSSGTSGAHITYGAYGIGYAPRITGGVDMNGQTNVDVSFTDLWKVPSFPQFPNFPAWGR